MPFRDARSLLLHLERLARPVPGELQSASRDLFYDAMDAASDAAEFGLLTEALELDPSNVDALLAIQRHLPEIPPDAEIEIMRRIVALAEKQLGKKAFTEFKGHFWGFHETRPYMRARGSLANVLYSAGRLAEAAAEWEAMLELNPGDNQGLRYRLLAVLVRLERMEDAVVLLDRYDEEAHNTMFAWSRVLERFVSGRLDEAADAAEAAMTQNAHARSYLLGHRRLPRVVPSAYSPGSKDEALCFACDLHAMWGVYPAALKWLGGLKTGRR